MCEKGNDKKTHNEQAQREHDDKLIRFIVTRTMGRVAFTFCHFRCYSLAHWFLDVGRNQTIGMKTEKAKTEKIHRKPTSNK